MTLTKTEKDRLTNAEETTATLKVLVNGAGSKNQLNQFKALFNTEILRMERRLAAAETEVSALLVLAKKLQ